MTINKISKIIVVLILISSFTIMFTVSLQESGIKNELPNITAGYSHVAHLDYRLNPENPPLVKILSAIPLLFLDLNFDTNSLYWQDTVNGQWGMGAEFLYGSGNNADQIIRWSRIAPMLLTLILISFVYIWSREIMGATWALLPTVITALTPTFLAHGHYVTTDIGATLGIFVATYYFVKFLNEQTKKHLIWAGVGLGVALLMKFSTLLLIPFFILLAGILIAVDFSKNFKDSSWSRRLRRLWEQKLKYGKALVMIFTIGFLVIYPFYLITTINYPAERQHSDTEFILSTFAGGPTPKGEICNPMRCLAELNIWASDKPLVRPYAQYMLGALMNTQHFTENNTVYFLGEVSNQEKPLYPLVAYVLKEPIPVLILIVFTALLAIYRIVKTLFRRKSKFTEYLGTHLAEFTMLLFIFIYTTWTIANPPNIGVRHLMPIMPFLYILSVVGLKRWAQNNTLKKSIRFKLGKKAKLGLIYILTAWFLISTALAYPFYLSYYNEFVGTKNGWKYMVSSNYDWGQDLKRLEKYVKENDIERIAVDYFGAGAGEAAEYYMPGVAKRWSSSKGDPRESGIEWLAISVNTIQKSTAPIIETLHRNPEDEYQWLPNPQKPYAIAGTSIFIYKLR